MPPAIYMYSKTVTSRAIWKYGVLWHSAISGINAQGDVNLNNIIESHATISIYMQGQTTGIRQLQWYYEISFNSKEGLYHIYGGHNVGAKEWNIATGCYLYT